jgi:hypothetical protein
MAHQELESASRGENMMARVDVRARITAATVGAVAASSVAVSMLWFSVGFVLYEPVLQAPWRGMSDYQSRFQPGLYLAWAIPAFLFALAFLAMIACIHAWADDDQRTWTLLAVAFAVPGATLMAALYYIQMTVVPNGLVNGTADSLRLWIYAPPYPFTFPGALEGVGYGFEGAALLLAAQAFSGDRLRLWVRWLLRAMGLSALVVLVDPVVRLPVGLVLADGALALILFTATPIFVAVLWWRSRISLLSEVRKAAASASPADLHVARPSLT